MFTTRTFPKRSLPLARQRAAGVGRCKGSRAQSRCAAFAVAALAPWLHLAAAYADAPMVLELEPFSKSNCWTFTKHLGDGQSSLRPDPGGEFMEIEASREKGMAATVSSLPFKVEAGREYVVSWFGRQGAGDILARYASGQEERALELLQRISFVFARDKNIYEAYDMSGRLAPGTSGWGNYTEHIGGYFWSVIDGPFGMDFTRDAEASATIRPRFPASWSGAEAILYLRGARVKAAYSSGIKGRGLSLQVEGAPRTLRVILPAGKVRIVKVTPGNPRTVKF